MKLFAIGDLHLPGGGEKPMDVFGAKWENHFARIAEDWRCRVEPGDIVLIPGDISWAMHLQDAVEDLEHIGALPGRKIIIRGNHDYWWSGITKVRQVLPKGMYALQNDALLLDGYVFCGTRGWTLPSASVAVAEEERIFRREVMRLEMTLDDAKRKGGDVPIVALIHYPPMDEKQRDSEFTKLFEAYGVERVVYGHLHDAGLRFGFTGLRNGIYYDQVSCDGLNFALKLLEERDAL